MDNVTFDAKTEAVIEKVRKLLALAHGNDNEHQAEAAANKARELLEAHNLDMAHIAKANGGGNGYAARDKQILRGGLYQWQRELWNQTASLNFCKYWFIRGTHVGTSYKHELLGSKVNVITTTIMAQYLEGTVERLAREWVRINRPGLSIFTKEAIAYREGMTNRLVTRMWNLRQERIKEEEAKVKAEREMNAARGVNTENALTIADVMSTEDDLNVDHMWNWPPGTSARKRKEREAAQEVADREAAEILRKQEEWDAAHPEEAAARKRKEAKEAEAKWQEFIKKSKNQRPRQLTAEELRRGMGSYRDGYDKGGEVSLDKQIDQDKRRLT